MKRRFASRGFRLIICAVAVSLFTGGTASAACRTLDPAFSSSWRGTSGTDINQDLNDYARIHVDGESSSCAELAAQQLINKINNSMASSSGYRRWLDGYNVALLFAAAQRIGANGFGRQELDTALRAVEGRYAVVPNGTCSNENLDTCMDDSTAAAAAYAWIAAYKHRRGHPSSEVTAKKNLAIQYIRKSMTDVCLHAVDRFINSDRTVLCNGTVDDLRTGAAIAMSVNHAQQKPPYGFGLMTGVASAILGLDAASSSYTFTADEREIANALVDEARDHISDPSDFRSDCAEPQKVNGVWQWPFPWVGCGGRPGGDIYKPNMYALSAFYSKYIGTVFSAHPYMSNSFDQNLFARGTGDNGFFSFGRYVAYGTHGDKWVRSTPEYMPYDRYDPIGYLEAVDANGVARGWACDPDKAKGRVRIEIIDNLNGKTAGWAELPSESAINNQCTGGTLHRFAIQLPSSSQGRTFRAWAYDFTWFGRPELPCLQNPGCTW